MSQEFGVLQNKRALTCTCSNPKANADFCKNVATGIVTDTATDTATNTATNTSTPPSIPTTVPQTSTHHRQTSSKDEDLDHYLNQQLDSVQIDANMPQQGKKPSPLNPAAAVFVPGSPQNGKNLCSTLTVRSSDLIDVLAAASATASNVGINTSRAAFTPGTQAPRPGKRPKYSLAVSIS